MSPVVAIPAELRLLVLAVVVGVVQMLWAAVAKRRQQGLKWAAGSRDEPRPVTGVAARLDRAFWNFVETFPFFAVAVIVAYLMGKLGPLTLWGSALYVASRAIFVPVYASGVARIRSYIWFASMIGLFMVIAACLF